MSTQILDRERTSETCVLDMLGRPIRVGDVIAVATNEFGEAGLRTHLVSRLAEPAGNARDLRVWFHGLEHDEVTDTWAPAPHARDAWGSRVVRVATREQIANGAVVLAENGYVLFGSRPQAA